MENSEEENEDTTTCFDFTKETWRDNVTFLVEDQRLYAAKTVLAIASPVFEAMFGSNFRERKEEEVPLPGKTFEDFNEFLHCIYPETNKKIDAKNVYRILPLADEYDVKSLINECKRFLSARVLNDRPSIHEVILCHRLATRYTLNGIRDVCATRLSDVGLEKIESSETNVTDTETLLQLYKDISKKQFETLEEARTTLAHIFMKKDLTVEDDNDNTVDLSETKGAVIKMKPDILLLKENERLYSNYVSIWNINFKVFIKKMKTQDDDNICVYLSASFPRDAENIKCKIDAKIQMKYLGGGEGHKHNCFTLTDREYSKPSSAHGYRLRVADLIEDGFIMNGKLDVVVYFLVNKPIDQIRE